MALPWVLWPRCVAVCRRRAGKRLDESLMCLSTVAATQDGITPLHVAAEYNVLPETIAVLVELGADPDAKDGVRVVRVGCARTPIHGCAL